MYGGRSRVSVNVTHECTYPRRALYMWHMMYGGRSRVSVNVTHECSYPRRFGSVCVCVHAGSGYKPGVQNVHVCAVHAWRQNGVVLASRFFGFAIQMNLSGFANVLASPPQRAVG